MNDQLKAIEPEVQSVLAKRPAFNEIQTNEEAGDVNEFLSEIKKIRMRIAEFFRPAIDKAYDLHKDLLSQMKQVDSGPAQAETELRGMLSRHFERERQKQIEAQRKADEEAKKKALKEAEKAGDTKTTKAIENGRMTVVSNKVIEQPPKPEGVSVRETWKAEVQDIVALAKAVGSGKAPANYIEANMTVLNSVVRSTKGQINIPGVVSRKESSVVKRS